MKKFLYRVFRVNPGEGGLVLVLSLLLFSNEMARQMSGIVGISDFLDTGSVNGILIVFAIDALIIIATGALASLIVDRFNRIELLRWACFVFALVFIGLFMVAWFNVPTWFNAAILFIISEQQWLIFPLFFWVLANDIFEMAQAKRLLPLLGTWGFVGKMAGISVALLPGILFRLDIMSVGVLTIEMVLILNTVIYMLLFFLVSAGLRNVKLRESQPKGESVRETLAEGWGFVREVDSFRYLMVIVFFVAMGSLMIEFRFLDVAKETYNDAASYKSFYASYLLVTALISITFQGLLTSRIITKFQLKNTFFILPIVMLGSAASMIGLPNIISGVGGQMSTKIARTTVDSSSRKAFQALVPEERRGRVSLFMDNYVQAGGLITGCIVTGIVVTVGTQSGSSTYFYVYLGIAVLVAISAIWAAAKMKKEYDHSMLNWRLKRRRRGSQVLDKMKF